jgi:hypothetical protein
LRAAGCNTRSPWATVPTAAGIFSPQRTLLRLDGHGYSPALLHKIVAAAGQLKSFEQASVALRLLAGLDISARHVGRLTQEVGAELADSRDKKAQQRRRREPIPAATEVPAVAVVEIDGGRLGTRQPGCGPGVHQAQAREDKIACVVSVRSTTAEADPQPQPPPSFLNPPRVARLVRQMRAATARTSSEPEEPAAAVVAPPPTADDERWAGAPKRLVRTCVATLQDSRSFGPLVAGEAHSRRFYQASRRALVADGQAYNWAIQRGYFPDFEPIVDFLHVLCYVYLAAQAVGVAEAERWSLYVDWLSACWQGRVSAVLTALRAAQEQLGRPPPEETLAERDPRRLVAEALRYLQNNQKRMDYPRYRRQGLPVTSSLVESLVGEFNARVKGRDKWWNAPAGAEAILQVRAAVLSEDDRLAQHFANRPGNPYRRRRVG